MNRKLNKVAVMVWVSVTMWGVHAHAEKPPAVELSATQIDTNNRAVRLLGESPPRTAEAIKLVEAALLMESRGDLLYLTLGRAYQLDGQCARAASQFDAAQTAPGVQGVPDDFVPGQLVVYRKELESCMGTLIIVCEPDDLELSLPAASTLLCDTPLALEPGAYLVKGLNPSSGIEVEIPVQVVGGKETRSQIKIPDAKQVQQVTPPVVVPPEEPAPGGLTWRVTPYLGLGIGSNVIEDRSVVEQDTMRYLAYADQMLLGTAGVEARVLLGTSTWRYGADLDARYELSVLEDFNADGEATFADAGGKVGLYPQVWWSQRVAFFAAMTLRPRNFTTDFYDEQGDDLESVYVYGSSPLSLGAGARVELGDLIGMRGLELSAAWVQPLDGGAPERFYGPGVVYSDEEPAHTLLPLELGLRAQLNGFTMKAMWEGWYADASPVECDTLAPCTNQRSSQFVVTLGWTLGN